MGNKTSANARLATLGYLPQKKRDGCNSCVSSVVRPGGPRTPGVVIYCNLHKACTASGGWCPAFSKTPQPINWSLLHKDKVDAFIAWADEKKKKRFRASDFYLSPTSDHLGITLEQTPLVLEFIQAMKTPHGK